MCEVKLNKTDFDECIRLSSGPWLSSAQFEIRGMNIESHFADHPTYTDNQRTVAALMSSVSERNHFDLLERNVVTRDDIAEQLNGLVEPGHVYEIGRGLVAMQEVDEDTLHTYVDINGWLVDNERGSEWYSNDLKLQRRSSVDGQTTEAAIITTSNRTVFVKSYPRGMSEMGNSRAAMIIDLFLLGKIDPTNAYLELRDCGKLISYHGCYYLKESLKELYSDVLHGRVSAPVGFRAIERDRSLSFKFNHTQSLSLYEGEYIVDSIQASTQEETYNGCITLLYRALQDRPFSSSQMSDLMFPTLPYWMEFNRLKSVTSRWDNDEYKITPTTLYAQPTLDLIQPDKVPARIGFSHVARLAVAANVASAKGSE